METNTWPGAPAEGIDTSIYGMPAFVTLAVSDMDASIKWYVEGLGMHLLARMGPLVHLRRWRYQDILLVPADGSASGGAATVTLGFAARADELAALAIAASRLGFGEVTGPLVTPWGTTDVTTVDPDGHVLVFTAPPAVMPDRAPAGLEIETYTAP